MIRFCDRIAVVGAVVILCMPGALLAAEALVADGLEEIVVSAQRLDARRAGIETQTGASTYTIDAASIAAAPGGDNTLLNQVILQAPDVAQDSFGQLHIRGEHDGLQFRLNGIILPEGISVFGQTLDARLVESLKLITGALPAEYGLRTAGVIDLTTKSGVFEPHGSLTLYGGSHSEFAPSFAHGGSAGAFNYFVSGDSMRNTLGIEAPDPSLNPLHDITRQYHGFGYFEYILNSDNRVTWVLGTSRGTFQIPNRAGLVPSLGLNVNGQTTFPSAMLDENQTEITHFGVLSWQHSQGKLDLQLSLIARYSSLAFVADHQGDLLFNGIAEDAYKRDLAYAWQTDAAYHLDDAHTVRFGLYLQHDQATSETAARVLPTDTAGVPISTVPIVIVDGTDHTQWISSLYVQDEWRAEPSLTFNYGARLDRYRAYSAGIQLSPRANLVWKATPAMTLHAGYARYFSPPPFELVGSTSITKFLNTTAAPPGTLNDLPRAERADYFDVGLEQRLMPTLTAGIDSYYKKSTQLIDEGQFGAPIILTPFNYARGRQYGAEFTLNYTDKNFKAYGNLALQRARGRGFVSAQFNFTPAELVYVNSHYIDLDHEQQLTASAGASYLWRDTRFSGDLLLGSGLRAAQVLADGTLIPNGAHLPSYQQVNVGVSRDFHMAYMQTAKEALTVRFDVINAFDTIYQIRNGTGVGVGAPQYGARRGVFLGVSIPM